MTNATIIRNWGVAKATGINLKIGETLATILLMLQVWLKKILVENVLSVTVGDAGMEMNGFLIRVALTTCV